MPLGNPIRKQNESRMVSVLATEGQTVFTVQGGYIINHLSVFRNGVRLSNAEDFTAGDGSTVTLNNAANIDDRIEFHVFDRFTVQNAIVSAASTQTISGDIVVNGKIFGNLDVPQINVASGIVTTHDLNVTGIVTATELDLNGKGDISSDLNVVGVTTVGKQVHVGTGVSIAAGGLNVTAGISTFQAVQGTTGTFTGAGSVATTATGTLLAVGDGGASGDRVIQFKRATRSTDINIQATNSGSGATNLHFNQEGGASSFGGAVTITKGTSGGAAANSDAGLIVDNNSNTYVQFRTPASNESGLLFGDDADNDAGAVTYNHSSNHLGFKVNASERMRIDSSGQMGLGVTPDTWSTGNSITVGTSQGTLWGVSDQINLSGNAYFNSGWKAAATKAGASQIQQALGAIDFKVSGSVTADNAITFIDAVKITNTGAVGINETSPGQKLTVGGDIQIGFNTPNDAGRQLNFNVNRGSAGATLANINWQWNSKFVAQIRGIAGADTSNKDDAHLAFFTSSANNLAERMRITRVGDIGVNTSDPKTQFHIQQSAVTNAPTRSAALYLENNANCELQFVGNSSNDCQLRFGTSNNSFKGAIEYELDNNNLIHYTNGSERMRIASGGEVSIGGFAPTAGDGVLQIAGGFRVAGSASASDTTSPYIYRTSGVDNLNFATNGVERVQITSAGVTRIINTANSSLVEPLRIENTGSGGGANVGMVFYNGNGSTGAGALARIKANDEGSYDSSLSFETGLKSSHSNTTTERMRITQTGYMGLGTPSPSQLLHVFPDADNTTSAYVRITAGNRAANTGLDLGHDVNGNFQINGQSNGVMYFSTNQQVRMSLRNDSPDLVVGANGGWNDYSTVQGVIQAYATSSYPANSHGLKTIVANTSYSEDGGGIFFIGGRRSTTSDYTMAGWYTGDSGSSITSDRQFRFIADGNAYADGSWNGGGADYAEFFEWLDGNLHNENRKGISVVLENGKIREANGSDNTDNIIGVISANPVVVGDSASERWKEKWITDDFGDPVYEEYTITEWYDETKKEKVNYATDRIPSDVTVGAGSSVLSTDHNGKTFTRKKLNPSWDSTATYIPRKDRKEWDIVGLMGKLKVKSDQPIGTKWIKIREISASVHEYLIR